MYYPALLFSHVVIILLSINIELLAFFFTFMNNAIMTAITYLLTHVPKKI